MDWSESRKAASMFGHLHALLNGLATSEHAAYPNAENPDEMTYSEGFVYVSISSTVVPETLGLELRWVAPSIYSGAVDTWNEERYPSTSNEEDGVFHRFENLSPYEIGQLIGAAIHDLRKQN